jgi:hypothetical protein
LLAVFLIASLPILSGCGLGTVGILLAVAGSGGGEEETTTIPAPPAPTILFSEDFETDFAQWSLAGSSPPVLVSGGASGSGFDPMGTTAENGEAVTHFAFNLDPGLAIRGTMQIPSLGSANTELWFGIKNTYGADTLSDLLAGFYLDGPLSQYYVIVNGAVEGTHPLDTSWHRYEIYLRPDGFVEFFVDGGLVAIPGVRANPQADYRPLTAGGKSAGGAVHLDEVEVFGHAPLRDIHFADNFGGGLSAWTVSGGSAPPAVDTTVEGNPLPSLNPGGDLSGIGESITNQTFIFSQNGLEIVADLYVSATGLDTVSAWAGLATQSTLTGGLNLAAGAALVPGTTQDEIRYYLNNLQVHQENLPGPGWYAFRVMIRPSPAGWRVEFHRDGGVVYVTDTEILNPYDDCPVAAGGQNGGGTARVDNVAVLSPPSYHAPGWTQLTDSGTPPPSDMQGHCMVWDPRWNRTLVAFGGAGGAASGNVTALEITGTTASWTPLTPAPDSGAGSPSARTYAAGAFTRWGDSLYIFGGGSDASGSTKMQDLWRLDLTADANGQWAQVSTGGPSARFGHTLVLDTTGMRLLLFAGEDNGGVTDTVWAYALLPGTWTDLSPTVGPPSPSARRFHGAIFDSANERMIVWGGEDGAGSAVLDGLWALDMTVTPPNWVPLAPGGPAVGAAPRWALGMTVDSARRRIYGYGGTDGVTPFHDLFALDLAGGADGVGSIDLLANPVGSPHGQITGAGMVYDPLWKRLILVGGGGAAGATASIGDLNDE